MWNYVLYALLVGAVSTTAYENHLKETHYHNITKRAVTRAHDLTASQKKKILDKHNELRREVKPVARNMLKMKWNDELEKLATEYSRMCLFTHNKKRKVEGMGYIGENIFISAQQDITDEFGASVVVSWDAEKQYYDYYTRRCQANEVCGHYTQVAWAKSELIGCGMTTCDKVNGGTKKWSHATLVVCNYSPGGNVQGQSIYESGGPSSACPEGYWDDDWLCSNSSMKLGGTRGVFQLMIQILFSFFCYRIFA